MSKILGVSYGAMKKWMGTQKYLLHPNLLYREEKLLGTRKLNFDLGNLKSERGYVKGGNKIKTKVKQDRREYYRNYYLTKEKPNPEKMEKRRERARARIRKKAGVV